MPGGFAIRFSEWPSTLWISWLRVGAWSLICLVALLLAACTTADEGPSSEEGPASTPSDSTPAAVDDDDEATFGEDPIPTSTEPAPETGDDREPSAMETPTPARTGDDSEPMADEPEAPAIDEKGLTVYFPRQASIGEPDEFDDVLPIDTRGPLALDDQGCLRLGDDTGRLIIWPASDYRVAVAEDEVTLIDEELDDPVAQVGQWISFVQGERGVFNSRQAVEDVMDYPLPDACADADGFVVPADDLAGAAIERIEPDEDLARTMGWDTNSEE